MNFETFLEMGGYAAYVWPSYAFTALAVSWMIFAARRAHRNALIAARKRFDMERSGS
jgi:heme exporter protein CcmD